MVAESMPVKNQNVMMRDTRRPCRNHSIAFVGTQHCNVRDDGGGSAANGILLSFGWDMEGAEEF